MDPWTPVRSSLHLLISFFSLILWKFSKLEAGFGYITPLKYYIYHAALPTSFAHAHVLRAYGRKGVREFDTFPRVQRGQIIVKPLLFWVLVAADYTFFFLISYEPTFIAAGLYYYRPHLPTVLTRASTRLMLTCVPESN